MKVLCLHGKGCNGAIFQSQTAAFRQYLSDLPIEYDFLNAPLTSPPAAGVSIIYEPPYYAYWHNDSLPAIQDSCTWLANYIARNGPFDAVMAFSQGAMLASSFLLLHQSSAPNQPPPFKAAIFFAGGPPLTVMDDLGFDIPEDTWLRDKVSRVTLDVGASARNSREKWTGPSLQNGEITEEELQEQIEGPYSISIPTVHFYGSIDPRLEAGVELSGLCEASKRTTYKHGGSHEIPRLDAVSQDIAALIKDILSKV